jgi:hypothetical protein
MKLSKQKENAENREKYENGGWKSVYSRKIAFWRESSSWQSFLNAWFIMPCVSLASEKHFHAIGPSTPVR